MLADEVEVVEGFLILADSYSAQDTAQLKERARAFAETSARLGLEMRRPWSMRHLAESTGRDRERQLVHRFLSKFVHPSSWIVNGREERTGPIGYRNLMVGLPAMNEEIGRMVPLF